MFNLFYKDIKLSIHPIYYALPCVLGALMFIPGWIYIIVFMYFTFITIPNMFAAFKVQNDLVFATMMPVSKRDIVGGRVLTIVFLELLHVGTTLVYTLLHHLVYSHTFYLFTPPNAVLFGFGFVIYGIFNIFFIPLYYRTAYQYGMPTIVGLIAILAFGTLVEYSGIFVDFVGKLMHSSDLWTQISILSVGIVFFIVTTFLAFKFAVKNFEKVDI